jgi:hypothetical protein
MSDSQVTLRTRKFIRNPLLGRKQMVVCVKPLHQRADKRIAFRRHPPLKKTHRAHGIAKEMEHSGLMIY